MIKELLTMRTDTPHLKFHRNILLMMLITQFGFLALLTIVLINFFR